MEEIDVLEAEPPASIPQKAGVLFYLYCTTSILLAASLLAITVSATSQTFGALTRGRGTVDFTSEITLLSPELDPYLPLLFAAILVIVLVLARRQIGPINDYESKLFIPSVLLVNIIVAAAASVSASVFVATLGGGMLVGYSAINSRAYFGVSPRQTLRVLLFLALVPLTLVEAGSALRWIANGFDGATPFSDGSWGSAYLDLQLFNLAYGALPQLVVLFFVAWAFRLLSKLYWTDLRNFLTRLLPRVSVLLHPQEVVLAYRAIVTRLLLVFSIISVAFVGVYAYLPAINPQSALVGVDVAYNRFYPDDMNALFQLKAMAAISSVAGSDRALYLLLQYSVAKILNSPTLAIRLMPALLGVLLVLASYWFAKEGSEDRILSAVTAMFAAFSLQVAVGINAGIYANWLAIALALAYFAVVLRGLARNQPKYIVPAALLSVAVLFMHPWTWLISMGVTATYMIVTLIWELVGKKKSGLLRSETFFVLALLGINAVADRVKSLLPSGSGLGAVYGSSLNQLSFLNILTVLDTLGNSLRTFLGGAMGLPVVFILSIIGLLSIPNYRTRFHRLLLSLTIVASIGILFTGFSTSDLQARILFVFPFQVFSAMGFLAILRYLLPFIAGPQDGRTTRERIFTILAFVSICSILLSYVLRTVGYLYTGSF